MKRRVDRERCEEAILEHLRFYGESKVSDLGSAIFIPNGNASNPGTLAATSILRSLEKKGVVKSRVKSEYKGYMRTYWSLTKE